MTTFNVWTSRLFDVLLAPFGHGPAWFDLVLWSVIGGVMALIVYKYASDQAGIERAKDRIKVHLYEIRLFRHDPVAVLGATGRVLVRNSVYVGHNLMPMAIMLVPMVAVLAQLEANYAFAPAPEGSIELLEVKLDADAPITPRDVRLELPPGVALDAPPVRTPDGEIFYRLRAEQPGDHVLTLTAGAEVVTKAWAVGGEPRKVPLFRTQGWEALLYPGEAPLPSSSAFHAISLPYPERDLGWLPGGELGVLATFFGLSLVAGFALKGVFGVKL